MLPYELRKKIFKWWLLLLDAVLIIGAVLGLNAAVKECLGKEPYDSKNLLFAIVFILMYIILNPIINANAEHVPAWLFSATKRIFPIAILVIVLCAITSTIVAIR